MSEIVDPYAEEPPKGELVEPPSTNVELVEDGAVTRERVIEEPLEEEIPPEPGAPGDLAVAPLAVREAAKLAAMTPEQRERYDAATAELMANPAVAAFAEEEARRFEAKKVTQAAFLAAYKKKQKEK